MAAIKESTGTTTTKTKSETTKSVSKTKQPIPFGELFNKLKKTNNFVTPRDLESIFNLEQPMVRRHLRAHFMSEFKHELGSSWQMPIDADATKSVITYFYERFPISDTISNESATA
jgi:predicted HTH transcriptional regulator